MAGAAVVAAALTNHAAHPFGLYVDGLDLLPPAAGTPAVPFDSITSPLTTGNQETFEFDVWDPAATFIATGNENVLFWDFAQDIALFAGTLTYVSSTPAFATGRILHVRCTSNDLILDQRVVPGDAMPAGLSDQTLIQHLIGAYGGPIRASSSTVASTKASMPAMAWTPMTLRAAIEQVANAAGTGRVYWMDDLYRLYYTSASAINAPFVVSDAPTGAQIGATFLSLDIDGQTAFDEVYVVGANAAGSGFVSARTRTRPMARQVILENTDSDSSSKRDLYGLGYLASSGGSIVSGTLRVEGSDGWATGQVLTITSASLGLSSATYLIKSVTPTFQTGAGRRAYDIGFGALPRSLRLRLPHAATGRGNVWH